MKDSKLIYFLRRLSKKELKDFQAYVDSPLFNRRNSLKVLLDFLIEKTIRNRSVPDKNEIYAAVYGDNPFNERSTRTAMAQLFALLRSFLAFSQYRDNEIRQQHYFLERLNEIKEDKYFPGYYEKAISQVENASMNSSDRHLEWMLLEESFLLFRQRQRARVRENHLQTAGDHLISGFLIRLLRYELQEVVLTGSFNAYLDHSKLRLDILEMVKGHLGQLPVSVQIYSNLLEAFSHPEDPTPFYRVREMLTSSWREFSRSEANEIYIATLNYTARRINEGVVSFLEESFELYQEMLGSDLIADNGKLSPFHFKNIINVALRLKRFDWAKKFNDEWRSDIFPDYAENAYHFNHGMLHFYQGEFAEAAFNFNLILQDFKDIFYEFNSKGYLLQIYYELGEIRSLESLAHSFRIKLGRSDKISPQKREQYLAFIRNLMRLLNIPPHNQERLEKLRKEIIDKPEKGMGTVWLLDKIDQFLSKR